MKFLIAGLGSIGRRHLRNLQALGEKDIILYRTNLSTLPEIELSGFESFTDLNQALDRKPDAVIVSNPTSLHLDVALPAARRGCHILLEKPVAASLEGLDGLRDAASRSGSRILVGFQFRFHPTLKIAEQLIKKGELGQQLTIHAHWGEYLPDWHPWEDYRKSYAARSDLGGGVIVTLTHPLDYVRWLSGEVDMLWSFNGPVSDLEVDVEDTAEIGLRFANGAIGAVHLNFVQRPASHRMEIVGTQGTLRWDNADGVLHFLRISTEFGSWGAKPPVADEKQFAPPAGFDRNDMFLDQLRHFIAVAGGKAKPACTLEDGINALKLALGARTSSQNGRPVRIS